MRRSSEFESESGDRTDTDVRGAAPAIQNGKEGPEPERMMETPSRMLSGEVLADARSREAREELGRLIPGDQVEQLCGIEAMAQVSA